jgi:lysophospholipase L1-like esterase
MKTSAKFTLEPYNKFSSLLAKKICYLRLLSSTAGLVFLLFFATAAHGLSITKTTALLKEFFFQGQKYSITANFLPAGNALILNGLTGKNLSAGLDGENIHLGTRIGSDNFYVFWLNYRDATIRLAFYDFQSSRSWVLPLAGFSFIGLPEIIEENGELQGLVFLGNRTKNDDIFYYEPEKDLLLQLTTTPFSEKGFTLLEKDGRLEIETSSLWANYRYSFDPLRRECVLLEKKDLPARQKKGAATDPAYYNTYIGFGDSITWGEMEGEQHLESCYLTQMKALLADPTYINYYGSSDSINLGVPGDGTSAGAQRVDQDLSSHTGFYFLLMLGVNDAIKSNLSVDSSLENLSYIIDAVKSRNMRVIVSTLTPSKSVFSLYAYYWKNLQDLSAGILNLASEKNVASIDTLSAFMNTNPPDGWRDLLENIIPNVSSGNHPNVTGNRIIAGLFAAALAAFPPLPPSGVRVLNPQDHFKKNVQWDVNYESDFSHFAIEFDFEPGPLMHHLTTTDNHFTFTLFPFLPKLYFRLQTVDRGDHASAFSTVFSAQTQNASPAKRLWNKQ